MQRVSTGMLTLDAYGADAPPETLAALQRLAEPLRGARVLHVNATPVGGGVAEILHSQIPLLQSLGIRAEWYTITGDPVFFEITKTIHNALQGNPHGLTAAQQEIYLEWQRRNAEHFRHEYDVVVVHDPQPLGLLQFAGKGDARWIWRLHIDSSQPNQAVWAFLCPLVRGYDAAVFTLQDFVPPDVPVDLVHIIPPAIDPLTPKNRPLPYGQALRALRRIGVDPARPIVAQVARLDPWKDPWGVIDAYRLMRQDHPDLQLVLLGVIAAKDDPEAIGIYDRVRDYAGDDPHIHIHIDPAVIGPVEVSAVQTVAQVVFQKSLREGFGLSVTEALWKATPVIGGRVGGIPLQLQDEVGGFLVSSNEEAAERASWLLDHPPKARVIAARGREQVRDKFLITRLLADELRLYHEVLGIQAGRHAIAAGLEAAS